MPDQISEKTIARLCLYKRILGELESGGVESIYSHELASRAGLTAAQLRRDIMAVGYFGSPTKGYEIAGLQHSIRVFLEGKNTGTSAVVGVGNIGRAILAYMGLETSSVHITACFDQDPAKIGSVIYGCRCYSLEELSYRCGQYNIQSAILAVPAAVAQSVTDKLVSCNIRGIMNFAPIQLQVPEDVFVENINLAVTLEKVHYFARK
ncbi:MAG: redox-sensing transcriptional repressor Rex [Sedimentisphaerales bacterium]|nr:redox-sensing transcriptional repressor Rex [Sedimentisphaerales bacterium]